MRRAFDVGVADAFADRGLVGEDRAVEMTGIPRAHAEAPEVNGRRNLSSSPGRWTGASLEGFVPVHKVVCPSGGNARTLCGGRQHTGGHQNGN